jgi:hypothetical protein
MTNAPSFLLRGVFVCPLLVHRRPGYGQGHQRGPLERLAGAGPPELDALDQ